MGTKTWNTLSSGSSSTWNAPQSAQGVGSWAASNRGNSWDAQSTSSAAATNGGSSWNIPSSQSSASGGKWDNKDYTPTTQSSASGGKWDIKDTPSTQSSASGGKWDIMDDVPNTQSSASGGKWDIKDIPSTQSSASGGNWDIQNDTPSTQSSASGANWDIQVEQPPSSAIEDHLKAMQSKFAGSMTSTLGSWEKADDVPPAAPVNVNDPQGIHGGAIDAISALFESGGSAASASTKAPWGRPSAEAPDRPMTRAPWGRPAW